MLRWLASASLSLVVGSFQRRELPTFTRPTERFLPAFENTERKGRLVDLAEDVQLVAAIAIRTVHSHRMALLATNACEQAACILFHHNTPRVIDHDRNTPTSIERRDQAQDLLHVADAHAPALGQNKVQDTILTPQFKGTFECRSFPLEHTAKLASRAGVPMLMRRRDLNTDRV